MDEDGDVTKVLIAVCKALHDSGISGHIGRAKTFDYDHDGAIQRGVEITLSFPQFAVEKLQAA